ncbi:hypothetical protein N0V93_009927 [Gnomoniopsis smithogilvyi]|uniref:Uncharacterized protein n=1 Tax=Gnomoniopsis smithogilvyi TaxID=1191159 RepID=A0A9W8YJD0_9PEZI|nr:hypothetical protein N0V93_009927 [Gnomoniopsis smithogilvyi]
MYSPAYGYGNAAGQPHNGAPQGQNPQMQPGPGPNQPQQQMMYNQQYPMGPGGGAFPGGPNPGAMMPGGTGPAGMMQNTAMPQMPANGQMGYQPPFTSSPYGPNVPSTAAASQGQFDAQGQFIPNYMMATGGGAYPGNTAGMTPQQQQQMMMQRMQHAQQNQGGMGPHSQQRQFPGPQGTPNQGKQSQFGTPQQHMSAGGTPQQQQQQQPHQPHQPPTPAPPSANSVTTPQTPTFPMMGQGLAVNGSSTPASPGTQAKDQERFSLLLDINTELLYEAMCLKHELSEIKKEIANSTSPEQHEEKKKEEAAFNLDFTHVSRRLQANLSYLANLTSNKIDAVRQPAPMYLSNPPLNLNLKLRPMMATSDSEKIDGGADREERDKIIKELYQKLHALFPGLDPNKEPVYTPVSKAGGPNPGMEAFNAQRMASMGAQMQGSSAPSPVSSAHHTTPQMATMPGPPSTMSA